MPKKDFTSKPIRAPKRQVVAAEDASAEEKLDDFYNESTPKIEKPQKNRVMWGMVILISILFGFGSAMLYSYLFNNDSVVVNGNEKIIYEKQEDVTVTAEERLHEISKDLNPVLVNFYDNSSDVSGPFYQDIYSFGSGFILTSDGWIVTTQKVIENIGDKDYVILTSDFKVYEVETILEDPISQVVFVKIDAKNLSVAKMGSISKANSGQKVFGFISGYPEPKIASLHLADLTSSSLEDVVASTEKFSHFVSAREGFDPSLIGSPIVNMAGEILAIVSDERFAIASEYLDTAISDLSGSEIDRVNFGVHYINLAKYPRVDLSSGEMRNKGALLSGYNNLTAVVKGSPASNAGLLVGDIIVSVEDEIVNGRKTLAQIIQAYDPGDSLKITLIRDGKEKAVEIILGKLD
jgi:serine protease Do